MSLIALALTCVGGAFAGPGPPFARAEVLNEVFATEGEPRRLDPEWR